MDSIGVQNSDLAALTICVPKAPWSAAAWEKRTWDRLSPLDAQGGQSFRGHLRAPWNTRRISTTSLRTR
jgi:hypothetical protein